MRSDMVIINLKPIEKFRRKKAVGKYTLYHLLGVNARTGKKALGGEPVSTSVAKRIADAIGVEVQGLIKTWYEKEGDKNKDVDNDEQ